MFWRQGLTELLQILLNHIKFLKQTRVRSPPNQEKIVSCHTCHPKGGQNIEKILKVKQFSKMLQYSFFCAVSLYEHIIFRNTPDLATFTSVWSLQTSNPAYTDVYTKWYIKKWIAAKFAKTWMLFALFWTWKWSKTVDFLNFSSTESMKGCFIPEMLQRRLFESVIRYWQGMKVR